MLIDDKLQNVSLVVKELKAGNVVFIPTDTVYGLATIIDDVAISKIFALKKRDKKPIAVLVDSLEQAKKIAEVNLVASFLSKKFHPGPLTIIMPKRMEVSDFLTSGLNSVGIRIPKNKFLREVLKITGPLAVTSANLSGDKPFASADEAMKVFKSEVKLYVQTKDTFSNEASTVIELEPELKILREGAITKSALEEVLKKDSF